MNLKVFAVFVSAMVGMASAFAGQWRYNDFPHDMSGKSTHQARVESDNSLSLAFPYNGPNKARLTVRKHPQWGTDIFFQVEKGQLMCRSYKPCNVSVKFDNKAPIVFKGLPPEDNDSTMTFLTPASKFIAETSKASRILVEVTLFKSGSPVLEFTSPVPLIWKPTK